MSAPRWSLAEQAHPAALVDTSLGLLDYDYARMVDGRTIHLHIQLVEPTLPKSWDSSPPNPTPSLALAEIEQAGMRWCVELAHSGGSTWPADCKDAAVLVGDAGAVLARRWAAAQGGHAPAACAEIGRAFRRELDRRRQGRPRRWLNEAEALAHIERLDALQPLTLLRELWAMWTPGWNRHLFILDSPHDTLPSLRAWSAA